VKRLKIQGACALPEITFNPYASIASPTFAHESSPGACAGVALDALPAPNLAAQSVRDAESLWMATQRRSYLVTARQSLVSVKAQWKVWFKALGAGGPKPQDMARANPEVRLWWVVWVDRVGGPCGWVVWVGRVCRVGGRVGGRVGRVCAVFK
jgi:hypothetical protein